MLCMRCRRYIYRSVTGQSYWVEIFRDIVGKTWAHHTIISDQLLGTHTWHFGVYWVGFGKLVRCLGRT